MFGHGRANPTLADVYMLTSLEIQLPMMLLFMVENLSVR
jgi:hypothetical protein